MLFDCRDIDLLKLTGCCKNLPTEMGSKFSASIFQESRIRLLQESKLLSVTANGEFYRLTPDGFTFLSGIGLPFPQDGKYISDPQKLARRKEAARIVLTFYRAGFSVFGDTLEELREKDCCYLSSAAIRRNAELPNHAFAGFTFHGICRNSGETSLCWHLNGGSVFLSGEVNLLARLTSGMECSHSFRLFGENYGGMAEQLLRQKREKEVRTNDKASFYEAVQRTRLPVSLIACGDMGAAQLILGSQDNICGKTARLMLGKQYREPELPHTDAIMNTNPPMPLVVCIDGDYRRIRQAYRAAKEKGYDNIAVIALREQLAGLAALCAPLRLELYGVDWRELLAALGCRLYDPPEDAYRTKEGETVNAAVIQTSRKNRKRPAAENRNENGKAAP